MAEHRGLEGPGVAGSRAPHLRASADAPPEDRSPARVDPAGRVDPPDRSDVAHRRGSGLRGTGGSDHHRRAGGDRRWAWDGSLLGAPIYGPGASLISATYDHGFKRLEGTLPPGTFGGFPDDYYSTGYNAGQGGAGLATDTCRDQGIMSYEFMIDNSQSGPYSWWESSGPPSGTSPWVGRHPIAG